MFNFQVGAAWRLWLVGLMRHTGAESLTDTIVRSCQEYARQVGYPETPPRRSTRPVGGLDPVESR
jgi:hypothetical protein